MFHGAVIGGLGAWNLEGEFEISIRECALVTYLIWLVETVF